MLQLAEDVTFIICVCLAFILTVIIGIYWQYSELLREEEEELLRKGDDKNSRNR